MKTLKDALVSPQKEGGGGGASSHSSKSVWAVFLDPTTNRPFFHHLLTGESQWEQPVELQAKACATHTRAATVYAPALPA